MAGLQRSVETFRRSGSSGLVWEERFSSELSQPKTKDVDGDEIREMKRSRSVGSNETMQRSGSNGGRAATAYRTGRVSPAIDPPSPKVSACGFCAFFGKPVPSKHPNPKKGRR